MGRGSGHGVSLLQRLMSRPRSQSAHGWGLLPWEAFWTFREPVRMPDYGGEGSFSSGGRTLELCWHVGERPVSMAGAVCVHRGLHAPCVTRHALCSAWLSAPAGTPAPCGLAPS